MNTKTNWQKDPKLQEVKLTYNTKIKPQDRIFLTTPDEVYAYLCDIWDHDKLELQEEFLVIMLDTSLRVLGWNKLSTGGKQATVVDVPHIAVSAVLANASSVIVAHNHPSGTLKPSTADIHLTRRISKALALFSISLDDHLIVTRDAYLSFKTRNLL